MPVPLLARGGVNTLRKIKNGRELQSPAGAPDLAEASKSHPGKLRLRAFFHAPPRFQAGRSRCEFGVFAQGLGSAYEMAYPAQHTYCANSPSKTVPSCPFGHNVAVEQQHWPHRRKRVFNAEEFCSAADSHGSRPIAACL